MNKQKMNQQNLTAPDVFNADDVFDAAEVSSVSEGIHQSLKADSLKAKPFVPADTTELPVAESPVAESPVETTSIMLLAGERMSEESDAAVLACNDYLRRGRFRSLRQLLEFYDQENDELYGEVTPQEKDLLAPDSVGRHSNAPKMAHCAPSSFKSPSPKIPTPSLETLKDWSRRFLWEKRALLYDAVEVGERWAHRRMVVEQGLSNDFARIQLLKALAHKLQVEVFGDGIHLTDKTIIEYPDGRTEIHEKTTYNSALVKDLLKVLADIASEKGERIPQPNLNAALYALEARADFSKLTKDQIERLKNGTDGLVEILLEPYLLPVDVR